MSKNMKEYIFGTRLLISPVILLATLLLLVSCKSAPPPEVKESSEPKTHYGQSVKKAKDVSKQLSAHDEEISRQSELLDND